MTCRIALSMLTQRRLWAESGGHCGNPQCAQYVFDDELDIDFGELAHIIPASEDGPRGTSLDEVSAGERAEASNVILLCPTCHTKADKAPRAYPAELLVDWKLRRQDEIRRTVGTPRFVDRAEGRAFVEPLLAENSAIHRRYGPVGDPYKDGNPAMWRRYARSTVVPNNRRLLQALVVNHDLLHADERDAVTLFTLHVDQFERRHVLDDFTTGTERFPAEIGQVFAADEEAVDE